jgi:hypothetical protein
MTTILGRDVAIDQVRERIATISRIRARWVADIDYMKTLSVELTALQFLLINMSNDRLLTIFVIYQNPSDYPGKFVVRAQDALPSGEVRPHPDCIVCDTIEQARETVPPGLVLLTRAPDDDPVIYETWI